MTPRLSATLAGTILAALGLFAAAPQTQKAANPIEAARMNNLGSAYMNQQLFEKGLKAFQQAATLDPNLAIAHLNEAIAYLNLQKIDEAKAALETALKQDPRSPKAWYNLGLLAKNTGEAQAAIDAFKRVTEIDANDTDTWYFLGTAYVQAKQFPQAIESFQHALQLNPIHASAEFGLSRAYQQSADVDHAREHLKKFQYITQNKIGTPMSLAYGEQGQYSRAVESASAVLKAPPQIKVQFVDVTKEAGITSKPSVRPTKDGASFAGPGACFLDYDNDGNIDLLLPDNGTQGSMSLYHNLGNGKFEDVTKKAGLDLYGTAISCTAGDYDNDGFTDLAVSLGNRILLLHNEKNGTFKDVTQQAGISTETDSTPSKEPARGPEIMGLTFIDYDHDGDLDLYATRLTPESVGICFDKKISSPGNNMMWRNNGNGTFTDVTETTGLKGLNSTDAAIGTDFNNDRAVDIVTTGDACGVGAVGLYDHKSPVMFENLREGKFRQLLPIESGVTNGIAPLDFNHDGWMDFAFTHFGMPGISLWRNNHGKTFEQVRLPEYDWQRGWGVVAFDYDNDGWVDLAFVGQRAILQGEEPRYEIKLFRNLGPDGFKDVTADVGLDKIQLKDPRAIITGDYDGDGATDLLITQNHGPAVLLRNEGGNQNHWLRLSLKGLNDNKSAIGTKVEVFSGGNRQKFEIYGSNGYLGQNSLDLVVGLGDAKEADIVRMLWPTGVLQDEIQIAGDKQQNFLEIDRRGSSCPTLFVWNGERYEFVADMLGAGVVGHWVGPNQRDIPRPVEYVKIDRNMIREKSDVRPQTSDLGVEKGDLRPRTSDVGQNASSKVGGPRSEVGFKVRGPRSEVGFKVGGPRSDAGSKVQGPRPDAGLLSFRFMEPLEEAVYLDQVRLLAVDHSANVDVYPNEYFASNPPYPEFKLVVSRDARPPAGAWDEHGHNVLPDLLAHRYFGDFALTQFQGFAKPHSLTLDLGEPYRGGPLWLLLHGEVEYFSANSMYAASQAGVQAISPYVEALVPNREDASGKWQRVIDDMGFPAGGPRTMTADLSGKLPRGTRKIRITTNLQVYWDSILINRTEQGSPREIPRPAGESAGLRDDARSGAAGSSSEGRHPFDKLRAGSERSRSSGGAKLRRIAGVSEAGARSRNPERSEGALSSERSRNLARAISPTRITSVPLAHADLQFHGYPLKIEGTPPGNVQYVYEKVSATGPYTRPAGTYTRYGDVLPLLTTTDDKLAVFGSGDEVRLDFDPSKLPALPQGWVRDYFFAANGYEKDMDFYAAQGNYVAPLPFLSMGEYPYPAHKSFPLDNAHVNYLLEYNTRHMSGNEQRGYWFGYGEKK